MIQSPLKNLTRRTALKAGAAIAGASAANLSLWAQAWAQSSPFKPEKGAKLTIMRWKRFIQAEEDSFMKLVAAFTKATGVDVKVTHESLDDVQPKASVSANTGQGPDLFWGLYSLPHLFPTKCVDVTDVEAMSRAVGQARQTFGGIDGFIHAAGVSGTARFAQLASDHRAAPVIKSWINFIIMGSTPRQPAVFMPIRTGAGACRASGAASES